MSGFRNENENMARSDKEVELMTDEKTGRRWVRRVLWGVAIVAAALLISGTLAAVLWCN